MQEIQNFYCKNCQYNKHQCFACGTLGCSDKFSGAEVKLYATKWAALVDDFIHIFSYSCMMCYPILGSLSDTIFLFLFLFYIRDSFFVTMNIKKGSSGMIVLCNLLSQMLWVSVELLIGGHAWFIG